MVGFRLARNCGVLCLLLGVWAAPAQSAVNLNLSYVDTGGPAYQRFKAWVDDAVIDGEPVYAFSATDAAYVYRIQGGLPYAQKAIQMVEQQVAAAEAEMVADRRPEVAGNSYLHVGPMIRDLAIVYDWCYDLLTPAQRTRWAAYAEQAIWNVWNPDAAVWGGNPFPWSGWSIDDPGNNYHYSFLEATMYWTLATNSMSWRTFLETQKFPPLLAFFSNLHGGGSREGTAYGLAQGRLFELYRLWRDATGVDLGAQTPHLTDSIDYWIHATVPTLDAVAPIGDQARVSYPEMYDYHRNLVLQARAMTSNSAASARASWWLNHISINPMSSGFNFRHDLLPAGTNNTPPSALRYHGTGTGHFFARSAWETGAIFLAFVAGTYDQSHAHRDQGAFTLYSGQFLAVTENIWTHSGLQLGSEAHNVLRFVSGGNDILQYQGTTSTMVVSDAPDGALLIDANLTPAYAGNPAIGSWQRHLRFANRMLRVHDQFSVSPGVQTIFQVNTPTQPQISGRDARAGNLLVRVLTPTDAVLTAVEWNPIEPTEFYSGWKIEVRGSGNEFLVELVDDSVIFANGFE